MTVTRTQPVRIGAIGMDQRQRNTLLALFSSKCENRCHLVEEASADLCILDLDNLDGKELWQEFRQRHPRLPLILVSLNDRPVSDPHTLFVRKPIPVQTLLDAIEQQSRQIAQENASWAPESTDQAVVETPAEHPAPAAEAKPAAPANKPTKTSKAASLMNSAKDRTFVGTAPDIDPEDPAETARIYYNPDQFLQGHLQQALNLAVRYNCNVAIEGPWPELELLIAERRVLVAAEERHLRSHCTISDATLETKLHTFDGKGRLDDGSHAYPLPTLFWKAALWAARGRLPIGTSLTQPIYLRRWPNFTRLDVTPFSLAIAALWAAQPRSLIDTAKHLQIPQRYVFAFYSAAKSLQLAGETRRAADTLLAPPEIEITHHRGLLGRVMDRLRGNSSHE